MIEKFFKANCVYKANIEDSMKYAVPVALAGVLSLIVIFRNVPIVVIPVAFLIPFEEILLPEAVLTLIYSIKHWKEIEHLACDD